MKPNLFVPAFALALCTCGVSVTMAQTNRTNAPYTQPLDGSSHMLWGQKKPSEVSPEDWYKFQKTKNEVVESTPDLKTQADSLQAAYDHGAKPSEIGDERRRIFEKQVKIVVLKQDSSLSTVYEALDKARAAQHLGDDGSATFR